MNKDGLQPRVDEILRFLQVDTPLEELNLSSFIGEFGLYGMNVLLSRMLPSAPSIEKKVGNQDLPYGFNVAHTQSPVAPKEFLEHVGIFLSNQIGSELAASKDNSPLNTAINTILTSDCNVRPEITKLFKARAALGALTIGSPNLAEEFLSTERAEQLEIITKALKFAHSQKSVFELDAVETRQTMIDLSQSIKKATLHFGFASKSLTKLPR